MRTRLLLPGALAALAALLSGCLWWGVYEEGEMETGDADFPVVLLVILLIIGAILLIANLSNKPVPPPQAPPQPSRPPEPQKAEGEAPRAAKPRRRQP